MTDPFLVRLVLAWFSSFLMSERWGQSLGDSRLNSFYSLVGEFVSVCCATHWLFLPLRDLVCPSGKALSW